MNCWLSLRFTNANSNAITTRNQVKYERGASTAVLGPGAHWGDVYKFLLAQVLRAAAVRQSAKQRSLAHSLVFFCCSWLCPSLPCGSRSWRSDEGDYGVQPIGARQNEVGVGGFLLGGGLSFASSLYGTCNAVRTASTVQKGPLIKFCVLSVVLLVLPSLDNDRPTAGLGCDNVERFEVVLANGEIVSATVSRELACLLPVSQHSVHNHKFDPYFVSSRHERKQRDNEHKGLFLALKGGGNRFRIVTEFEVRVHPLKQAFAGAVRVSEREARLSCLEILCTAPCFSLISPRTPHIATDSAPDRRSRKCASQLAR